MEDAHVHFNGSRDKPNIFIRKHSPTLECSVKMTEPKSKKSKLKGALVYFNSILDFKLHINTKGDLKQSFGSKQTLPSGVGHTLGIEPVLDINAVVKP